MTAPRGRWQLHPGCAAERVFARIGGIRQGMLIQCTNPSNPVLLFVHGGPGMPEFFLQVTHPTGLEQDFTIAWWEQRGAGMSFASDIPPQTMTFDRMIDDAIEVADFLRDRYRQTKVYLLAHSWGSFIGIQAAARAPERFHAYIGMAQVVQQLRSEELARTAMIAAYAAQGNTRMVRRLTAAPVSVEAGMSPEYLRLRDHAMHQLGAGTTRDMRSVITGVFLPVCRLPVYTVRERVNLWRGKAWSQRLLWDDFLKTDLGGHLQWLEVPTHFFVGEHDLTAMPSVTRRFFESLWAPHKAWHSFGGSAHSPLFEEPERARDILNGIVSRRSGGQ